MALDLDAPDLAGRAVRDKDGRLLGDLDIVFGDRATGASRFGGVSTARGMAVVPLDRARLDPDDGALRLPFTGALVSSGPRIDADSGTLDATTERAIEAHFAGESETVAMPSVDGGDATAEVTLSEEQLLVETERVPAHRLKLRKEIVEEEVTLTVTLRREELVVEREPIGADEALVEAGEAAQDFQPLEIVLWAEEPVVTTRSVPSERVRLRRNVVTEEREISAQLRRERAEVDQTEPTETP